MARKKIIRPAVAPSSTGPLIAICGALLLLVWIAFGQTLGAQFINYDDSEYVYENPAIKGGLTPQGIGWAFTHRHGGNWHPLTSISHQLDCSLFALNAGAHHFENVLLHSIAVLALFLLLRSLTGALWRSAFVAALFAIHPLRVESVAWIAERKDVLSGVFFMLSLGAYVWYVRQPSRHRYWLAVASCAGGLMAKPMLVTLPVILLILDYWPLKRFAVLPTKRLLLEKLPFFALAAGSSLITLFVQQQAIATIGQLPIGWRMMNAFVSYLAYIGQMFWPVNLGLFYPFPEANGLIARGLLSLALLILLSVLVFLARQTRPYLLAGWLWYLVMLLPVIGVIQVGMQAHADRYTYLPQLGLYLALTWAITDLSIAWPRRREILATSAGAIIFLLTFGAWKQTSHWHDSETIWRQTVAVTGKNGVAESALGDALIEQHRYGEAIPLYQAALEHKPDDPQSAGNLAYALRMTGRLDDAIAGFEKAVQLSANESPSKKADAHKNLGAALLEKKQTDAAIAQFQEAIALSPTEEEHTTLANVLLQKGRRAEAITQYDAALKMNPNSAAVLTYLSWALATAPDPTLRNGPRALELAGRAHRLAADQTPAVGRSLAAAQAETGRFSEAIATAQSAIALAESQNDRRMLGVLRKELALYQSGRPYHGAEP